MQFVKVHSVRFPPGSSFLATGHEKMKSIISPGNSDQPLLRNHRGGRTLWAEAAQGSSVHGEGSLGRWYRQTSQPPAPPAPPGWKRQPSAEPRSQWCRCQCREETSQRRWPRRAPPTGAWPRSEPASLTDWRRWCSCGPGWRCRSPTPEQRDEGCHTHCIFRLYSSLHYSNSTIFISIVHYSKRSKKLNLLFCWSHQALFFPQPTVI